MSVRPQHIEELKRAKRLLEKPSLAATISDTFGAPIEKGFRLLPWRWHMAVNDAARKSVEVALDVALRTLGEGSPISVHVPSNWWHKVAVGTTGAAGGALGLPALAIELPLSTTLMLRSIADIARSEGSDLRLPGTRLECIQILALGGRSKKDDAAETGYFAMRAAMAKAISEAATHVAQKGLSAKGSPVIVRFISQIASRFSIVVSEKAAAQAIPILGALGGATINTLFLDHFQQIASGHFIVRRLECLYGSDEVQRIYQEV